MRTRAPGTLTHVWILSLCLIAMMPLAAFTASPMTEKEVGELLKPPVRIDELRGLGPGVLPVMASIYTQSDENERVHIANAFYQLGLQSDEAYTVLMQDIHTSHPRLRLEVQWALGRVSRDDAVVETLLDIMRNDGRALFRDKAACALANDMIHLDESQKADLYAGLIEGLGDSKLQVRDISIKALKLHTGQTKGYRAAADEYLRNRSIQEWHEWLADYRKNL